ncbi:ATP synthase subunit a [Bacteroidia bacterium]|nr:ATP synthase subunit a [Bacteroidia bacterium]
MKRLLAILLALVLVPGLVRAQHEKLNVRDIVMDHLGDSYGWHITTVGHRHITIPLPVIVLGSDHRWHLFSSSHLDHGAAYEGFSIAPEGDHKGRLVENGVRPPLDISLTKNSTALLINTLVLLLLLLPVARHYRRGARVPPKGMPGAVEMLVEYIEDEVIEPCVGPEYRRYAPYLLTVFFFILVNNFMGLIPFFPGGGNVTGNVAVTMTLALATFVVVNLSGTREYWREIFWPDVPTWLKIPAPIMPAIEFVGIFTKPFALMIRLFANVLAGHAVILGLVCVIFMTVSMGTAVNAGMTVVAALFGIFMLLLEVLVAFIQAYVFTLLSSVFIGMARVKHDHDH